MSVSIEKIKMARKKKDGTTRKSEIARAMMQLRRMRKENRQEAQSRLGVVIKDGLVLVQIRPTPSAEPRVPAEGKTTTRYSILSTPTVRGVTANELNSQLRLLMENASGDRDRILHTLKEASSTEAIAFYESLSKP